MGKILTAVIMILTAAGVMLTAGGNTAGCPDNHSSIPSAGFYSMSTLRAISVDSLTIGGVDAPCDSTSFFIHYNHKALNDPRLNDTITFDYDSYPYFASAECGAMYQYRITRVEYTRHLVDSVGIVDSLICNIDLEQIHIYMRTSDDDGTNRRSIQP